MQKSLGWFLGAVTAGLMGVVVSSQAAPWAIVVDSPSNRICTLDFSTPTPTVHGPFLRGQMGSFAGGLFDVAVTPDGETALISNFGDSSVYRVDVSDPARPIVTGSVTTEFFAEDIAITPNGQYALVTDGGFSPKLGVIDLSTFTTSITYAITSGNANAVAVAPDNQTVIMADYFSGLIVFGALCPTGLVAESFLPTLAGDGTTNRPVNAAVAPDGQTVVVINSGTNEFNIYRITSPGVVVPGVTPIISCSTNVPFGGQSIAFSPSGDRVYLLQNGMNTNITDEHGFSYLTWLQVNGPGDVAMGGEAVATLAPDNSSQLFGVDVLSVSPDGAWALAGNPTLAGATNMLSLVNLSDFSVTNMDVGLFAPVGVEFIRTPDVDHTLSVSPVLPVPRVGQTVTCRIAVTNSGYATLDPVRVDLMYDSDYLEPVAVGLAAADVAAAGMLTWTNAGALLPGAAVELTAQFEALQATLPGAITNTAIIAAQVVGNYPLSAQTSDVSVIMANVVHPVWGDYDGDGKADPALYVESTGEWYARFSGSSYVKLTAIFGGPGDVSVKGDFDGDGKADPATYTPSTGTWRAMLSGSGYGVAQLAGFGAYGKFAVPGDYDGDGKSDLALYESATGNWYGKLSASGYAIGMLSGFGAECQPLSGRFDADMKSDPALYDVVTGDWKARLSASGYGMVGLAGFGGMGYRPVVGDFDGDGLDDPAIYRDTTASWRIRKSRFGYAETAISDFGAILTKADAADYDNDGLDDPLYLDEVTGKWHILLSSMGYIEEVIVSSGYLE